MMPARSGGKTKHHDIERKNPSWRERSDSDGSILAPGPTQTTANGRCTQINGTLKFRDEKLG